MIILFEGIDKAGKSTLIRNFVDLSQMPVFKNPIKPPADIYSQGFVNGTYFGAYESARKSGRDMIFDRSHITEMVYSEVKRGYKPQLDFWLNWEEFNKHYVVVVFVDAKLELLKQRFKDDKEEYLVEADIEEIGKKYEEYFKASKLSLVYIDGSVDRQRMLTQLVIQLQNLGFWSNKRPR